MRLVQRWRILQQAGHLVAGECPLHEDAFGNGFHLQALPSDQLSNAICGKAVAAVQYSDGTTQGKFGDQVGDDGILICEGNQQAACLELWDQVHPHTIHRHRESTNPPLGDLWVEFGLTLWGMYRWGNGCKGVLDAGELFPKPEIPAL